MKTAAATLLASAAALLLSAPVALAQDEAERPLTKGEEKLEKMLDGREAGEPQRCIRQMPSDSMTVIDGTAIVFKRGRTLWVNYTQHPRSLDDDDTLVIRKYGSGTQLCRVDHITTIDRFSGFYTGSIFLGDFVPYTKVQGS